jgi:hypothetical protein
VVALLRNWVNIYENSIEATITIQKIF